MRKRRREGENEKLFWLHLNTLISPPRQARLKRGLKTLCSMVDGGFDKKIQGSSESQKPKSGENSYNVNNVNQVKKSQKRLTLYFAICPRWDNFYVTPNKMEQPARRLCSYIPCTFLSTKRETGYTHKFSLLCIGMHSSFAKIIFRTESLCMNQNVLWCTCFFYLVYLLWMLLLSSNRLLDWDFGFQCFQRVNILLSLGYSKCLAHHIFSNIF